MTVFLPLTDTDRSNGPIARHLTEIRSALEDLMTKLNGARDSRCDDQSILGNWLTDCQPCGWGGGNAPDGAGEHMKNRRCDSAGRRPHSLRDGVHTGQSYWLAPIFLWRRRFWGFLSNS